MDDIDRELKKVQLMREQLALDKELARRAWKSNAIAMMTNLIAALVNCVVRFISAALSFLLLRWRLVVLVVVLTVLTLGVFKFIEKRERAEEARQELEVMKYVRSKCISERCESMTYMFNDPVCSNERFNYSSCESQARKDFFKTSVQR